MRTRFIIKIRTPTPRPGMAVDGAPSDVVHVPWAARDLASARVAAASRARAYGGKVEWVREEDESTNLPALEPEGWKRAQAAFAELRRSARESA